MITLFEILCVGAVLGLALAAPQAGRRIARGFERLFSYGSSRQSLCIAVVGAVVFCFQLVLSYATYTPKPLAQDEFAYLLSAETFAGGRVTNTTHPLWEHFESPHIIQQPTYQSKYPPLQGAVLALGQVCFGHPIVGVWLSLAFAGSATCWMLYGWLPGRWALFATLLVVTSPGIMLFWGQNYWGGAVAMAGGALFYGALPRLIRDCRVRDAVIMACGLAILANSRPYEGALAVIPAVFMLGAWICGSQRPRLRTVLARAVLPICLVMVVTAGWMGFYNYRVTGDAFKLPYLVWRDTHLPDYSLSTALLGVNTVPGPAHLFYHYPQEGQISYKIFRQIGFYFRFALLMGLIALPAIVRTKPGRFALVTCALLLLAVTLANEPAFPHYTAMATGLVSLIVVNGMRQLRCSNGPIRPVWRLLVAMVPAICVASLVVQTLEFRQKKLLARDSHWSNRRAQIVRQLEAGGAKHLIVVRYAPGHPFHDEWVYNAADIDNAKVVWAHELDGAKNRRLLEYFHDRNVWLLQPDIEPLRLVRIRSIPATPEHGKVARTWPNVSAGLEPCPYPHFLTPMCLSHG